MYILASRTSISGHLVLLLFWKHPCLVFEDLELTGGVEVFAWHPILNTHHVTVGTHSKTN